MLTLNRDLLEEIVPHFNVRMNEDEAVQALQKFMFSGKEPYAAALRYFSHVDTVIIANNKIRIVVERHLHKDIYSHDLYMFPYTFTLLDDIMGVLETSNKKLVIEGYPSSLAGRKALARLTQKHLKSVDFDDSDDLPSDYYNFFKNECNLDDASLDLCNVKNPSFTKFFELSAKHRNITTHFAKFFKKLSSKECTFPSVETLKIDPCTCEEDFDNFHFVFTKKLVVEFTKLVVESMPNLKKLDINFSANPEEETFTWQRVYSHMKKFSPEMFKHIPIDVKGQLNFYADFQRESFKNIIFMIPRGNPGVDVDNVENRLVKKFDIHDGLSFIFVLQFCEDESEDEYLSEDDEYLSEEDEDDDFGEDLDEEETSNDEFEV